MFESDVEESDLFKKTPGQQQKISNLLTTGTI